MVMGVAEVMDDKGGRSSTAGRQKGFHAGEVPERRLEALSHP